MLLSARTGRVVRWAKIGPLQNERGNGCSVMPKNVGCPSHLPAFAAAFREPPSSTQCFRNGGRAVESSSMWIPIGGCKKAIGVTMCRRLVVTCQVRRKICAATSSTAAILRKLTTTLADVSILQSSNQVELLPSSELWWPCQL